MSVKVTHRSSDYNASMAKTTVFKSNSWTISEGHLTVGDSFGNPDACFAPENWFDVVKVVDVDDED